MASGLRDDKNEKRVKMRKGRIDTNRKKDGVGTASKKIQYIPLRPELIWVSTQ